MGRRKFRFSIPKSYERLHARKGVGRPRKVKVVKSSESSSSSSSFGSLVSSSSGFSSSSECFSSTPEPISPTPQPSSPILSPDSVVGCQTQVQSVVSRVSLPSDSWIYQIHLDHAAICKVSEQPCVSRQTLVITFCVIIRNDMSWSLSVHGHQIDLQQESYDFLCNVPKYLHEQSLQELVSLLDKCSVCPGNYDEHYVLMVESMKGRLMSKNRKTVIASIDDFCPVTSNGKYFAKTVRVSTCGILVTKGKYKSCVVYRNSLRSTYHRWSKKKSSSPSQWQSIKSKVNLRWLNTPEKAIRYGKLRSRLDAKSKQIKCLKWLNLRKRVVLPWIPQWIQTSVK